MAVAAHMHCMQMFRHENYQPEIPHRCWEHHCLSALLLLWSGWWWWSGMRNANTETSGSMMWLCVQVVRWRGNIITEIQLPAGRAPAIFYSFALGRMRIARTLLKLGGKFPEHCGMVAWQAWNFTPWSSHLPCGILGVSNFAILHHPNTLLHSLRTYRFGTG